MKKPEKAAAMLITFLVFVTGSTGLVIGGENDLSGNPVHTREIQYTGCDETRTIGGMLSCVIGAMLDMQCFLLDGEPDIKLASLSVLNAVYRGDAPGICEYSDEAVAVLSQTGMARLYSGMFAHGEITALDTSVADENVHVLGDKIVIFLVQSRNIGLELVSAEEEADGSVTVICRIVEDGGEICRAKANLIKTGGWAAGYSINSLDLTY